MPRDVPLKDASRFRLIGKPLARLDTPSKVDGSAEFGLDVKLPGMLYAVVALCPTLGGKVISVESSVARAMPGVRDVLTTLGGVVVVADHFWQAHEARDALRVRWDEGPNTGLDNARIRSMIEAAAAGEPGASALGREEVSPALKSGDAAEALKKASKTLSAVYELPMLAHAAMEPMNCTADVGVGRCDLYVGTQVQQMAQAAAADAAGLKPDQVNVHTTLLGGGFGRRLEVGLHPGGRRCFQSARRAREVDLDARGHMTHDYSGPVRTAVSAGLDEKGRLLAWALHVTSPSITARFDPTNKNPFDSVIEYVQNFPYAVSNFDLRYTRREIGIDVGYLRSVSHGPNCFAVESSIDELALAAAVNPLDFRLALLAGKPRHTQVLKLVAERSGWGRRPRAATRDSLSWKAIRRSSPRLRKFRSTAADSRSTKSRV